MSDYKPSKSQAQTRAERLAAKLRENLHRRKAQARQLGTDAEGVEGTLSKDEQPR